MEAKMLSDFHMGLRPAGSAEKNQNNQINWLKPDSSQSIFQIFRFYFILRRKTIAALRGSISLVFNHKRGPQRDYAGLCWLLLASLPA